MKKSVFMFCCALCIAFWGITANQAEAVMKLQLAHEQPEIHPYHIGGSYNLFQRNDGKGIRVGGELLYGYDGLRVRVFDHPRGLFTEVRRFDNAVLFQGLGSFGQSS